MTTSEEVKAEIDKLTHEEMCRLWRFAPPGHKYFMTDGPYWKYFDKRFKELGGMTHELSKLIGW